MILLNEGPCLTSFHTQSPFVVGVSQPHRIRQFREELHRRLG